MAELIASAPLERDLVLVGPHAMRARSDIAACLIVSRAPIDLPGAIAIGPGEWLMLEEGGDRDALAARMRAASAGATALAQDMSAAYAFVELTGPAVCDLLGIAPIVTSEQGAVTARVADLRVTVEYRPGWARIAVERFSAEYLWMWLERRMALAG